MFANVSLPFYFLICPNIRQPRCDIVTDGLVDLRSCSCKPPGFVCLTDVLEAPCHYMPSGCVLGSGLSRLDLHTADTLTGALGWAEPERRPLIFSVWFRILKCVSCEDKSPKVLGNYICKVLHWTNVAQTFLNYFIQFLQNRWFASLLLHLPHVLHTKCSFTQNHKESHTHTPPFLLSLCKMFVWIWDTSLVPPFFSLTPFSLSAVFILSLAKAASGMRSSLSQLSIPCCAKFYKLSHRQVVTVVRADHYPLLGSWAGVRHHGYLCVYLCVWPK